MEGLDGALQAFVEARDAGLVRFLGVTGHHTPKILEHAVKNWPVDSVLLPVNPAEAVLGGFLDRVMTAAKDRGLAVIAREVETLARVGTQFLPPGYFTCWQNHRTQSSFEFGKTPNRSAHFYSY
jgi:hypothetical protein